MDRCDKCSGAIISDGKEIKCFNCGKRFLKRDELSKLYVVKCKVCGSEFTVPTRNKKLCVKCERKAYRKIHTCAVCGEEFIARSKHVKRCQKCRTYNRNEDYIKKNKILVYSILNSIKKRGGKTDGKIYVKECETYRVLCKHSTE